MAQDYTIFKVGKEESFLSFSEFFCCLFFRERKKWAQHRQGRLGRLNKNWTKRLCRCQWDNRGVRHCYSDNGLVQLWSLGISIVMREWNWEDGDRIRNRGCETRKRFRLEESRRDWWRLDVGWEEKFNKLKWRNHRRRRVFDSNRGGERARDLVRSGLSVPRSALWVLFNPSRTNRRGNDEKRGSRLAQCEGGFVGDEMQTARMGEDFLGILEIEERWEGNEAEREGRSNRDSQMGVVQTKT